MFPLQCQHDSTGFYGFGWFHDDSTPFVGTVLSHGGTDGHNYAETFILPQVENCDTTKLTKQHGVPLLEI